MRSNPIHQDDLFQFLLCLHVPKLPMGWNESHEALLKRSILRAAPERLSLHRPSGTYAYGTGTKKDLLILFKSQVSQQLPTLSVRTPPPGVLEAIWKAHKLFRTFYHIRAVAWKPHKYQHACCVRFIPAAREAFFALLVVHQEEFVPPVSCQGCATWMELSYPFLSWSRFHYLHRYFGSNPVILVQMASSRLVDRVGTSDSSVCNALLSSHVFCACCRFKNSILESSLLAPLGVHLVPL